MVEVKGKIFDIQRFCLFDGDGIRTTVFFKGCPLNCKWCCNPESQSFSSELLIKRSKDCVLCQKCIQKCEKGVLSITKTGVVADGAKCGFCKTCEDLCAFDKIKIAGKDYTVKEVVEIILKDKDYYDDSLGGVTLSGGEVSSQPEFVMELITALKKEKINVMIETCGFSKKDTFVKIAKLVDRVYFDIKVMDENTHIEYTGQSNKIIKENLQAINGLTEIVVRVPIIKNINMNESFIKEFAGFINPLNIKRVELLPYHKLGISKYEELNREYKLKDVPITDTKENIAFYEKLKEQVKKEIKFK